jgi:nucleoside-diphosphate-sugar epimerase
VAIQTLITGATGFLGGAVAAEAVRRNEQSDLLLLARGADPAQALARVRDNLRSHGVPEAVLDRLSERNILCGDLENLDELHDDPRLDQVKDVIHSAALATFSNHPCLDKVNVEGTRSLARLMRGRPALGRFFYVGTAMACGPEAEIENGLVNEHTELPLDDSHLVAYTRSKARAEQVLREEFPDLPSIMLRPSIIVGDTRRGCVASQSIFWVFQVAQMLGEFTVDLDSRIDVVPVDWCASAILDLVAKPVLANTVYHLSAGEGSSVSFREVDEALAASRGVEPMAATYRQLDREELGELLPRMRACAPGTNDRLLMRALRLYGGFAELNYVFANANALGEGIEAPPRFTEWIGRCHESARHIPIATQMEWDFK